MSKMSLRSFPLLAVLMLPAPASAQTDDEKAAIAAVHRMFEGMRTADSGLVRSAFAAGARFASLDARVTPAAIKFDVIDGWIAAIATSNRRWDEQIYDVQARVDGNIAQVWAPYTFYLDKAVRHCGVNAIDMLRDDAGWKIIQIADTRRREGCRDPLAK